MEFTQLLPTPVRQHQGLYPVPSHYSLAEHHFRLLHYSLQLQPNIQTLKSKGLTMKKTKPQNTGSLKAQTNSHPLPPFFNALTRYVSKNNVTFACPGHQGIDFFSKHPAGKTFLDFFGENLFRADVPHADPVLGELLSHGGPPGKAEEYAATVFNADKTYFVLNGTSASNKVVANALLTPGDIVLFDRNNHKSCYHGALILAGATPVYLETSRNDFGLIGGIPEHCFEESYLREKLKLVAPERALKPRPFRLAILQLGTWDGTVYNAKEVIAKIGHLCEYVLFDSAWLGYEQFIPVMRDCSPLLLNLTGSDPGVIVTQSVHKQLAGFSQASQIHKKDNHIKQAPHYCNHDRFNNSFMLHASTSPFYPLFASLDINAKIHSEGSGKRLWEECVRLGVEARKAIFSSCKMIKPFIPSHIENKSWQSFDTHTIVNDLRFFTFGKDEAWHNFSGYGNSQYLLDPCKLLLTTPGVNATTGNYEEFGVPATILAHYLRENGIVPEKSDLNSIVFLLTPALSRSKIDILVSKLRQFELHLDKNSPLKKVIPSTYRKHKNRYANYTILDICQEMHSLYSLYNFKKLQRDMFSESYFPHVDMHPYKANLKLIRGEVELIPLRLAEGRVAAEGAVPYPPGIICIAPGERWGGPVFDYILSIEHIMNSFPAFGPDVQGVHIQIGNNKKQEFYVYVVK
ncbi:ornithine decarboxylase [Pseudomonas cichorii]|nr:ornithine decarboxylase [Pseudomonas cichorii]MBX8567308.1 ornithine decarboxylase [Pseudomonas cichorii]MBX8579408.1 ornithine decarboxylase [Pseudomonas cichorii]MBX8586251.1 ornithine decarboxylase [Pseudomonas cichorii]MBX8596702.1 ornithine decarboxylase [Pseudomonas cichorii]